MMDLALALGMPVSLLSRFMSEREFARWLSYIRKRQLPQQRVEFYLAQIAYVFAAVMGSKTAKLSDFVLDFEQKAKRRTRVATREVDDDDDDDDDDDVSEEDLDDLKAVFAFKPRQPRTVHRGP